MSQYPRVGVMWVVTRAVESETVCSGFHYAMDARYCVRRSMTPCRVGVAGNASLGCVVVSAVPLSFWLWGVLVLCLRWCVAVGW